MKKMIKDFSQNIYRTISNDLILEDISKIKVTNGNKKDAPRACKKGSSVYILYNFKNEVIYIGETGESIKSRCYGDGSGAHCHKKWFENVKKVRHYTKDSDKEFTEKERKVTEQALSVHLSPKIYGDYCKCC